MCIKSFCQLAAAAAGTAACTIPLAISHLQKLEMRLPANMGSREDTPFSWRQNLSKLNWSKAPYLGFFPLFMTQSVRDGMLLQLY